MKSQSSLVAQHTRLSEWADQIRECKNRPSGMTVEEWCHQHGITKANYYWRLRKVREVFLEINDVPTAFVELPAPPSTRTSNIASSDTKIVAILKGANQLSLEITDQASESFLNALLGVLAHA